MICDPTYTFDFGKYRGYTLLEVYKGNIPSSTFIEHYLKYKFKDLPSFEFGDHLQETWNKIEVTNYQLLPNCEIILHFNSTIGTQLSLSHLNYALSCSEEWPRKKIIGSPNEVVFDYNKTLSEQIDELFSEVKSKISSTDYNKLSVKKTQEYNKRRLNLIASPDYIFWAIKKIYNFIIDPKLITELEAQPSIFFHGIDLTPLNGHLYKYNAIYSTINVKFPEDIIIRNQNKYDKYHSEANLWYDEEDESDDIYKDFNDSGSSCSLCGGSGRCLLSDPQGCPRGGY